MFRENVAVKTPSGDLVGHLFVGADGLPELYVTYPGECKHALTESVATFHQHHFRPQSLPHEWIVTSPTGGTLYDTWDLIWNLIEEIAIAEREAEESGDA